MKTNCIKILGLFLAFVGVANAQDSTYTDFDGKKITITGEGTVTVNYGKKIGDDPLFKDSSKIETEVKYYFLDKKAASNFKVKTIKAPKIKITEPLEKIRKRYVAFGINDFKTSPYAELAYTTLRNRKYSAGFEARHFSQKQGVGSPIDALYGNSEVALFGKKFYEGKTLYATGSFENNTLNFHGFNPDAFLTYDEAAFKRGIGKFDVELGINSNLKDQNKWGYDVNLNYQELSMESMTTVENKVDLNANINKYMEWKKYEWFKGVFNLDYQASYLNSGKPNGDHESLFFKVFPSFDFKLKDIDLKIGAQTFYQNNTKKFNAMPFAEADFGFVKDVLHIFGRFQNDYQRLSYLDYVYENPFVAPSQEILNVNTPLDFMAGLKGAFSSNSSFNVGFRYRQFKEMPIFFNLPTDAIRQFNVITDEVTNRQGFAEFIQEGKKLKLISKLEYNLYDVFNNEAYNMPAIFAETRLAYNLQDKIVVGTELFFYGEQLGLDSYDVDGNPVTNKIDPIFDFNIDVRYNYSDKLGAFLRTNNILNTKHYRWDQYANYGFNFLIGVDYNF